MPRKPHFPQALRVRHLRATHLRRTPQQAKQASLLRPRQTPKPTLAYQVRRLRDRVRETRLLLPRRLPTDLAQEVNAKMEMLKEKARKAKKWMKRTMRKLAAWPRMKTPGAARLRSDAGGDDGGTGYISTTLGVFLSPADVERLVILQHANPPTNARQATQTQ